MDRPILSLSRKAALAVAIILLPVLISFIYSYTENKRHLEEHVLGDLHTITEAYDVVVAQFIEMSRRRTEDFASDGRIRGSLSAITKGRSVEAETLSQYLARNKRPLNAGLHTIHVMTTDGVVAASTDPSSAGRDVSAEPYFKEGLSATSITETSDAGVPSLTVSTPVRGLDTGKPVGVIANTFSLNDLSALLAERLHPVSSEHDVVDHGDHTTMEAYIVNGDGLMITGSRSAGSAALGQRVDSLPVRSCLESGREVTTLYVSYRGVEVAGSSKCIRPLGWTLLVEVGAEEMFASVWSMRTDATVAAVIIAALVILLYVVFHRTVVARLRGLSEAARVVSSGDYGVSVLAGTNDEIGELTRVFNEMTAEIRARDLELKKHDESLRRAQEIAHLGNWDWDIESNTLWWSDEIYRIFGLARGEFGETYEAFIDSVHEQDRDLVKRSVEKALYEGEKYSIDHRVVLPDGTVRTVHEEADVVFDDGKRPLKMIGTVQDITERRSIEDALRISETRYSTMFRTASDAIITMDEDSLITGFNRAAEEIFGYCADEVLGKSVELLMPERYRKEHHAAIERFLSARALTVSGRAREYEALRKDGTEFPIAITMSPAEVEGRFTFLAIIRDMTVRKEAELELKKLSAAIEQSVNLVFITDVNGIIEYVNPKFEHVTGYTKEEAIGQTPRILSSGETPNSAYEELWATITAGRTWRNVFKNRTKSGGNYWCNTVVSPIQNDRGETTHFLAVQEDVTEKMISQERLERLASYDDVTGLMNRSRFMSRLDEWILGAKDARQTGALILIDVDQFKFLNDTFGHATGDVFLKRLAKMIESTVPSLYRKALPASTDEPVIGRMSGDEFAILLPSAGEKAGLKTAEGLREAVSAFRFTDEFGALTISSGVVCFPEHGVSASELFTRADAAMYRAKELGRNKCHLYRPADRDLEKMHSRTEWKEKIQKALKESRFEPWFQPILKLKDNSIHHYEVLARMRDEDGSILLPGAFIEVAERFGLVGSIDRMIIEKTLKRQAALRAMGRDLCFSVNLSGIDLGDEDLLAFLKSKITDTGSGCIVFEITETAAVNDMARAKRFIQELKSLGCQFSLDDFGVGFTSFVYLKELDVDFIKIDGSFIKRLHERADDRIFVKAMKEVAEGLGIKTIAEFVENAEVLELLRKFGIDYGQGYHIGKPVPSLEFADETVLWGDRDKAL